MSQWREGKRLSELVNLTYAYLAVAYSAIVAILYAPTLLNLLGADAFGLVGLFLTSLACFQFIDAAVIPTATRQTARFRKQLANESDLQRLKTIIQWPILVVTLIGIAAAIGQRTMTYEAETEPQLLTQFDSLVCTMASIGVIAMRALAAFDRGVLIGLQRHNTIYTINVAMSSLRYPILVALLTAYAPEPTHYFLYQFAFSLCELLVLRLLTRNTLPTSATFPTRTLIQSQLPTIQFIGMQMAMSLIWLAFTQVDKILLATILPLAQYGYLTLAIAAASGTSLATAPIAQMLLPRLTLLHARNSAAAFSETYLRAVRLNSAVSGTLGIWLAIFSEPILFAWTGNQTIASDNWPILSGYAIGNIFVTFSAICYVSQQAIGKLRLHFVGLILFALVSLPLLYIFTRQFGAIGAGVNWAITNAAFAMLWIRLLHRQFSTHIHKQWLMAAFGRTIVPVTIGSYALSRTSFLSGNRLQLGIELALVCVCFVVVALILSGIAQELLWPKTTAGVGHHD